MSEMLRGVGYFFFGGFTFPMQVTGPGSVVEGGATDGFDSFR